MEPEYEFFNIWRCTACASTLNRDERYHSEGRCPHCGHRGKVASTVVDAIPHAARRRRMALWERVLVGLGVRRPPPVEECGRLGPWVVAGIQGGSLTFARLITDIRRAEVCFSEAACRLGFTHAEAMQLVKRGKAAQRGDDSVDIIKVTL